MQLELFYRNSLKALYDITYWETLQIEILRRDCTGELHHQRMVEAMINRSTDIQLLGYLKYGSTSSRSITHKG